MMRRHGTKCTCAIFPALFGALLVASVTLICAPAVRAQEGGGRAVLEGRVTDAETGEPLPGANVAVPALRRGTSTDARGRFALRGLEAPGRYEVAASYVGFRTETRRVALAADDTTRVEVALAPSTLEAAEVVVEAARVRPLTESTQAVARLDAAELARARGQTLGETLSELPGVTTLQTGPSISKPVIRGLHSQRVKVVSGGVALEGQQWGGEHAPAVDPFAPSRVEVVRGAASVEHGAGAIGGAIRVEPRPLPQAPGLGGEASLNAFSNNRQGAGSLLLEGGVPGAEGVGWRAQGSFRKAGDARTPGYVIGNSAFEQRNLSLAAGYEGESWGAQGYASHFGTELGIFSGAHIGNAGDLRRAIERGRPARDYDFSYEIGRPRQTVRHDVLRLSGHYDFRGGERLGVQYSLQRNRREEYDAHRPYDDSLAVLGRPAFALTLLTHDLDADLRHRPLSDVFGGDVTGKVGVSGQMQTNLNGEAGYLIPNFRSYTGGAFARETWERGDWTVEAGARYDVRWLRAYPRQFGNRGDIQEQTDTYGSLSGVLGAIWEWAPHWSLAANLGAAWRPPSVNELYSYGVHHGTAQFEVGQAGLRPERSRSADLTLRHESRRAAFEVSAYANRIDGYIHLFPTAEPRVTIRGVFPSFHHQQTDALLRGIDGSARYRLTDWLQLGATASVVRGDDIEADRPLVEMPADQLALSSTFALPNLTPGAGPGRSVWLQRQELELKGRFVREQTRYPKGVLYAPPPEGYALASATYSAALPWLGAQGRPATVSLSVENLFDTQYRDYLSRFRYFTAAPGRSIVLRVQVPFGTSFDS